MENHQDTAVVESRVTKESKLHDIYCQQDQWNIAQ